MSELAKKISIKSRKMAFGENIGEHITSHKGDGYDFCELREYETGDDIKKIDWIISAKYDKAMVKIFSEQREQNIIITTLLGSSMYFGTDEFKNEKAAQIASLVAFLALKQGDTFEAFVANDGLNRICKKSNKIVNAEILGNFLADYESITKWINFTKITNELMKVSKQKAILFLIGDFLDLNGVEFALLAKKYELFVAIVRDRFEEEPKIGGHLAFCDNFSKSYFEANFDENFTKSQKEEISKNDIKLYEKLTKAGARFAKFYTNENEIKSMRELLK